MNDGVVPRLDDLDLARDYNAGQLQKHYRNNTEVPYSYIKDIDFPTMAKFSEHDVGLPGVDIAIKPVRSYVYGALAAQCWATSARRTTPTRRKRSKYTFYQGDVEGKSNVEKIDGRISARQAGHALSAAQRQGHDRWGAARRSAEAGRECLPDDRCADSDDRGGSDARRLARGAAVVVDPNNGDVLAMASVPSFDPNTFIPSIKAKDWEALQKDEAQPLVNRAISAFPPGSTFKIVTSLAGLRGRKISPTPDTTAAAASVTATIISIAGSARKAAYARHARTDRRDQGFVRFVFLSIRKRGRNRRDRSIG